MKRNTIIAILIIILAAFGFYVYDQNSKRANAPADGNLNTENTDNETSQTLPASGTDNLANNPEPQTQQQTPPAQTAATEKPKETQGTWSTGSEAEGMAPDILVEEISYNGTAFSPATLDVKVGDIVIFRNNSSVSTWPASGPHPTHTGYPEFDPGKAIAPGGKWQFTFEKVGTWGFHDHLNPSAGGTITVSER